MRLFMFLTSVVVMICSQSAQISQGAEGRVAPNIVLIFIDDMGWKDAGFMGSDFYQTPHINQLAEEGMVFTSAYAAAGNCAPSRACMISGQYTPRHHVYAVGSTDRGPKEEMKLDPVPNKTELEAEQVTFAEGLKLNGYRTGMFGKWHLGYESPHAPADQGFDVADAQGGSSNKIFANDNDPKHIYYITKGACDFMSECVSDHKDQPFFLYVAHHATHMSIQAREEMYAKMEKQPAGKYQDNAKYGAMNAQMDDGVGLLLEKIDELGLRENTLVLFTSDNGALPQSPPYPLRGYKGMYYEGGIRVPMIVRWPGVVKPGSRCDVPVINVDFYPTFLEVAGGKKPEGKILDGTSLVALLKGDEITERAIYWHFPGYLDGPDPGSRDSIFRSRPETAMRKGDWKLLLFHEEWMLEDQQQIESSLSSVELYNLKDDISESKNLLTSEPEKARVLLKEMLAWHVKTNAKLPTRLEEGQKVSGKQGKKKGKKMADDENE